MKRGFGTKKLAAFSWKSLMVPSWWCQSKKTRFFSFSQQQVDNRNLVVGGRFLTVFWSVEIACLSQNIPNLWRMYVNIEVLFLTLGGSEF